MFREAAARQASMAARMSTEINIRMGGREWAILGLLSILWGGSFLFIEVAVRELAPFTLVLGRVAVAALILLLVLKMTGRPFPFARSTAFPFLVLALLNNAIPFSLFAWGQQHIAIGLASILNATTPLWAVLTAHLFTQDERATPLKVTGVAVGFAGVAAMIGGDLSFELVHRRANTDERAGLDAQDGLVAEWLRRGLQILAPRFDSGRGLQMLPASFGDDDLTRGQAGPGELRRAGSHAR